MDRYSTPTNEHEARVYLAKLVRHFKTKRVALRIGRTPAGGYYDTNAWPHDIVMSKKQMAEGHIKWVLIHEFTHHLSGKQNGRWHGKAFAKDLMRVVRWCYQDPAEYPWSSEYRGIKRNGRIRALIGPEPAPYVDLTIYPHELHKFVQLPLNLMEGVK